MEEAKGYSSEAKLRAPSSACIAEEQTGVRLAPQVDEAYMLLSQAPLSLSSNPAFSALKRELMGRAESNKAAARALRLVQS